MFTCRFKQQFQGYVLFDEGTVTDTTRDGRLYVKRYIILHQAESQNFCMV
jgi:TfoX/Sxy family transcriptional regulator of competence genes